MPTATPNDECHPFPLMVHEFPSATIAAVEDLSLRSDSLPGSDLKTAPHKSSDEKTSEGDSDDRSIRPGRVRRASVAARTTTRLWKSEFTSLVFGAFALAAIIGVLAGCNGKGPPKLPYGMTMNALVSILIGILYLSFTSPLSSCLAQLKWNHFHKARKLNHFQKIDFASRSVHGCLAVFSIGFANPLACLAAFLFLAIQAIGPFVQQIVSIQLGHTDVIDGSYVPVSRVWTDHLDSIDLHNCTAGSACDLLHSYDESTRDPYKLSPEIPVQNFANCTWEPYWTLAVCYDCRDATELLQVVNRETGEPAVMVDMNSTRFNRWLLPNGHYLDPDIAQGQSTFVSGNLINMSATQDQLFEPTAGNALLKLSVISTPLTLEPVVLECTLQLCAQERQGSLIDGDFEEPTNNVAYFSADDNAWDEVGKRAVNDVHFLPGDSASTVTVNDTLGHSLNLTVNSAAFVATTNRMGFALTGFLQVPDEASASYSIWSTGNYGWLRGYDPIFNSMYNSIQMDWKPGVSEMDIDAALHKPNGRRELQTRVIHQRISSIASGLTHTIRGNADKAYGTGKQLQLFVRVDWRWLSLPIVLFILTLALLLATIWDTRVKKMNVWSDDALATIVHGMDVSTQTLLRNLDESSKLSKVGKEMKVILKDVGLVKSLSSE